MIIYLLRRAEHVQDISISCEYVIVSIRQLGAKFSETTIIEAVRRDVTAKPRLLLRKCSAALNLKRATVHKIIKKDLKLSQLTID